MGVGSSGEVYVFGVEANKTGKYPQAQWKCVEKVWTYVHHPVSNEGGYDAKPAMFGLHSVGTTVFALSDRWLAYCPAEGGALSAGGDVGVPIICPSLVLSQIPPPQPSISAAVSLEDEALFNRMAREVTQGLVRAAGWAADAGMKKFQSYWNGNGTQNGSPPQSHVVGGGMGINGFVPPNSGIQPGALPQPSGLGQQIRQYQMGGQLPQTYTFTPQHANDPRLVSIIDLQKPRQENTPPMATVLPPSGASFLSFAPGGLHLLSVSTKGDLIMVWDLMKVVHHPPGSISMSQQRSNSGQDPKAMAGPPETIGRYIRLIARHARLTVSTVVEVDWSSPRGEKFAVITERGTAHFYDLPYPALQWPPQPKPPPSYASSSPQTTAAGAAVSGAVNLFNSSTQPLLTAARRRRSRSSSVGSPTALFGSPTTGRRGPTAGTPPTDAGESKINLPTSSFGVSPGCVKFLTAKERGHVAVLGGGVLRIYELRPSGSSSKPAGVSSGNWWEYDLPTVPSASHTSLDDFSDGKAAGFWAIRSHWNRASDNSTSQDFWKTPLAWAEIETSGNRMPWHQDRRVKMFFYTPPPPSIPPRAPSPAPDHTSLLSPWPTNPELPEVRSKKKPRSKTRAAKVPDTPSPQLAPQAGGGWVFGLPMVAERVFLRDRKSVV